MPTGQGFNTKCGLGEESTWGTGVAIDEVVTFLSEDIPRAVAKLEDEYLDASVASKNSRNSAVTVVGTLNVEAVYDEIATDIIGIDALLKGAFGNATFTTYNEFEPASTVSNSYTIAFEKNVSVWEIQGAKINTLEISGSAGGKMQMAVGIIGKDLLRTGDSGIVNASSAFTALTPATDPSTIAFDDLTCRMDIHGAALTSADQKNITEFSLSFNNNFTDPTFATPLTGESGTKTLEPIRNGRREVTFTVTFPRYTEDTLLGYLNADTPVQVDFQFSLSASKKLHIYLPNCKLQEGTAPIGGAELFPLTLTFKAHKNGTTNTNMTFTSTNAITEEIGIETLNARTAIP